MTHTQAIKKQLRRKLAIHSSKSDRKRGGGAFGAKASGRRRGLIAMIERAEKAVIGPRGKLPNPKANYHYMIVTGNGEAGPYDTKAEANAALRRGIADHGKKAMRGWRIKKVRKNPAPFFGPLSDPKTKASAKRVQARVRDLENNREGVLIGRVESGPYKGWLKIRLDNTSKAYFAAPDQVRVLAENPKEKLWLVDVSLKGYDGQWHLARKPIAARNGVDARQEAVESLLIHGGKRYTRSSGITAAEIEFKIGKAEQIDRDSYAAARKRWGNPARKQNFGLTDLAFNLQAADYLKKVLKNPLLKRRTPIGRALKNPASLRYRVMDGSLIVSVGTARNRLIADAANKYRGLPTVTLAIQREQKDGSWKTTGTFRAGKGGAKRNPSVSDLSKTFQGKVSGSASEFKASNSAPGNLARIGKLIFLKLAGSRSQTRVPGAMVAVDTSGKLWIVGNRTPLFSRKAKLGEALDFGHINQICYETAKSHIENGKTTEYVHSFGEEGGRKPRLLIDSEGMPILRGGDYKIKAEGIVD